MLAMKLSTTIRCGHCANKAPMQVLCSCNRTGHYDDHRTEWDAGFLYEILECFSCHWVDLLRTSVHTELDPEGIDGPFDKMFFPILRYI